MSADVDAEAWRSRPGPIPPTEAERRVRELVDFHLEDPDPLPGEWPHDHPPGDCRPVDGPMSVDEHESQPREPMELVR